MGMNDNEIIAATEAILFVSGEPVFIEDLAHMFGISKREMKKLLKLLEANYTEKESGIVPHITEESIQLVSNKKYAQYVTDFVQPVQTKSFSQSMLETLTIVAYRQPITRAEIDFIRGVRCEYSISQLIKQGFIAECGRKEVIGRPQLLGTTDKFLRKFGMHSIHELPEYERLSDPETILGAALDEKSENLLPIDIV